jgi:hypothetical protein
MKNTRTLCDNCKTPLPGKGQGFVTGYKKVCGRAETMATVRGSLVKVKLGCDRW